MATKQSEDTGTQLMLWVVGLIGAAVLVAWYFGAF